MFFDELEAVLDFPFEKAEIISVLVKLRRVDTVETHTKERAGPGRRVANAYALSKCSHTNFD